MSFENKKKQYGTLVYDLETSQSLEDIIKKSKLKARYNPKARQYMQLIEDLNMPNCCHTLTISEDGEYLIATGTYPPQLRCYELKELQLKFQRSVDHEISKLVELEGGYRKLCTLRSDRYLEFHAPYGTYHKVRLPRVGRDLLFDPFRCEMIACAASDEIYSFDLQMGMFKKPISLKSGCDGSNAIAMNPVHQLIGVGCDNGVLEMIDPREQKVIQLFDVCKHIRLEDSLFEECQSVTSLTFEKNGIGMAVGTDFGQVAILDMRKDGLIHVKDHNYEAPIRKVMYHDLTNNIISVDKFIVKVWNTKSRENITNIEVPNHIKDVAVVKESGMLFVGGDRPNIKPLYVPKLGPAPRWASFIDSFTEELDAIRKATVSQDFRFVSLEDIKALNAEDLLGSDLLRPYMNGFYMKLELYRKLERLQRKPTDEEVEKSKVKPPSTDLEVLAKKKSRLQQAFDDDRFSKALQDDEEFRVDPNILQEKKRKRKESRFEKKKKRAV